MNRREKDLYMTILVFMIRWSIFAVVFFFLSFFLAGKMKEDTGLDKESPIGSPLIERLDVMIELNRDASAQITEMWQITTTKDKHYFAAPMNTGFVEQNADSFSLIVNGQAYRQVQHEKLSPGEFRISPEQSREVEWVFDGIGSMEAVFQYRVPGFVGDWNGSGAAMTYRSAPGYPYRIEKATVRIFMDDEDLSRDALYSGACGFRGEAGFDGPVYRAETLKPLVRPPYSPRDCVEIQLLLSENHFDSLPEGYIPPEKADLHFDPNDKGRTSVYQQPISLTLGRISRIAAIGSFILAAAIALQFAFNWYWVWRRKKDYTDLRLLSEINHRHWKRHFLVTMILAFALLGALILSLFCIPVQTLAVAILSPSFLAFLIAMSMAGGLSILSKINILE